MDLNLKNDVIFKVFFSRAGNEKYLREFLEALLKIEIKKIIVKEEVNLEKLFEEEKGGRLDLLAELNDGICVDIEMQVKKQDDYLERTAMYGSKMRARESQKGLRYDEMKQIVLINILDFELFDTEDYISKTVIVLDNDRECEVMKNPKWYFIELPKFRKRKPDMDDKLEQWLLFIDDYDRGMIKMAEEKNETLKQARNVMNYLTGDEEVKRLVELRERWEIDRNLDMKLAKEEGEKNAKIEMARKMLKDGENIEKIEKYTGLMKEEIEELK